MSKKVLNVAVILAAGRGERSGFSEPKQLVRLAGRPVVEHTISAFQNSASIDHVLVVTNADCISAIEAVVSQRGFSKVKAVILGGSERYESSMAAIAACSDLALKHEVRLIFHDAVRPLVDERIIHDVVAALAHYNAVDVVVPATDTIIVANSASNVIEEIPSRAQLRSGQTPQGFSYDTIRDAYATAMRDPDFKVTDDCGVVKRYLGREPIYLVNGNVNNMKLTYQEDLHVLDKLLQLRTRRIFDQHDRRYLGQVRDKVIVIFGGTSGIGAEIAGLAGAHRAKVIATSRRAGVDISQRDQVEQVLAEAHAQHGRVDWVINSASILNKQPLRNMSEDEIVESVAVNYLGAIHVARAAFPYLQTTHGHLLNFTSSSYTYGRAHYGIYSSSKAAVVNLTQALAEEWAPDAIRVNCVNPERTATPMRVKAFGREPEGSLLKAEHVARRALDILLSDATGQVFDVRRESRKSPIAA